jgi:hypothetical protein
MGIMEQKMQEHIEGAISENERLHRELIEAINQKDRWFNEHQKVLDVKNEMADEIKQLRGALEAWIEWEDEQIKKEGPYVGKAINALIIRGRLALKNEETK